MRVLASIKAKWIALIKQKARHIRIKKCGQCSLEKSVIVGKAINKKHHGRDPWPSDVFKCLVS